MTRKKSVLFMGMTLDSIMGLVLLGFGIGLCAVGVINGGISLLLLLLGLPLLAFGVGALMLAWRHRL